LYLMLLKFCKPRTTAVSASEQPSRNLSAQTSKNQFLPTQCDASAVLAVIVCPSVRPSVTRRYYTKTAKLMMTQTVPYDSAGTQVFWCQQSLVGDTPFPMKFALKVTHPPLEHNDSDQYPLTGDLFALFV